jgi:4-hydroxy-tetrahydrodipicolinate reductase
MQAAPMIRGLGIAGIAGRMGQLLAAQAASAGLPIAGGLGRPGSDRSAPGIRLFADVNSLAGACDVLVDFTHASAVAAHAAAVATAGCAWVLGTSGLTSNDEAAVARAASRVSVVYAANFSPGVTLALELAERLGAALPAAQYDAEILEMHHRQKVDAPSGTAIALGRAVARGRGVELAEMRESGRDGQTGARRVGAIGFAALRGGQVVGEHTVIFAAAHEHLTLTHRAFDRAAFAAGAIQAARWVAGRPPGLYGMRDVLGLT